MPAISRFIAALLLAQAALRDQGISAFNEGRYSVALAKLTEAAKDQKDTRARVFLALTQAAVGNCGRALPDLTDARIAKDSIEERLSGIAAVKCYSAAADEAKTFSTLAQLEQHFPNDADVLYLDARLHMKWFNDATFAMFQRTPASYRVHELSAEIFEVQSRYPEAVTEYRKAIELNGNAPDLHFRLGRALLLESHSAEVLKQAAAEFTSELKLNPEDGACEFQLGQIAQVEARRADAKAHFSRAVELSPNFVQALIALAKIAVQEKNYSPAITLLNRAVELQPANESAHYALLEAYRDSGQTEKAKAEKAMLDKLQKPPEGEFSDFLKKLGAQPSPQSRPQ